MPGFFISNKKIKIELHNMYPENCKADSIEQKEQTIMRNTLDKFMMDKAFDEDNQYICILDGVLLNKRFLFKKYKVDTVEQLIKTLYELNGETYFKEFRGSFSGALFDKGKKKWIVFTNQIGDHPIFYYFSSNYFYAGSQVNYIIEACNVSNGKLTFDESAAYQMLTFAFMVDNSTFAKEIKRLRGGTYLVFCDGIMQIKEYFTFHKHQNRFENISETELIETIDQGFKKAVKLEYDKDDEYNYKHLCDLSGGLDSRMNMWVAHEISLRHMQCLTYCQANYLDEIIAKEIAQYWNDELLVKPLDDVSFMYDIDKIIQMNGGLSLYAGITGGMRMLESLNQNIYGVEHTGMIGDVVVGSFLLSKKNGIERYPSGRYSEKLVSHLPKTVCDYHKAFDDEEIYLMYVRCFHGAVNTHLIRQNYTEVASPFLDVDFLQLCLDIPADKRMNHKLYKKWIISKYPEAAKYRWEKTGALITESRMVGKLRRLVIKGPQKLMRMMGKDYLIHKGMNPLDYWLKKNQELQRYLDMYVEGCLASIKKEVTPKLYEDMRNLYRSGNVFEKSMVITVLGSFKLYLNRL